MTNGIREEIIQLADAYILRQLTQEQADRLEQLLEEPWAASLFADLLHDHAALHWSFVESSPDDSLILDVAQPPRRNLLAALALAACVAVCALGATLLLTGEDTENGTFARMVESRSARWESSDLPTSDGARLGAGTLRLEEGLATILFDSGVEVVLEAPAEMQLLDEMNCLLHGGTALAEVPEGATGFTIETPTANVVDFGTRFAVNVDEQQATLTQVFEGRVEVEHPASGQVVELRTGERNSVAGTNIGQALPASEEGEWAQVPTTALAPGWIALKAVQDAYVADKVNDHVSDTLLLLKSTDFPRGPSRRVWLEFELSALDRAAIAEAELVLQFAPTGWGLASVVPDAVFSVHALTEPGISWNESDLSWQTAPGNSEGGLRPDASQKLGDFVVERGLQRGAFGISGEPLARFLRTYPGERVTLVIIRETLEEDGGGLVHAFASHRHPVLPAPTLLLRGE